MVGLRKQAFFGQIGDFGLVQDTTRQSHPRIENPRVGGSIPPLGTTVLSTRDQQLNGERRRLTQYVSWVVRSPSPSLDWLYDLPLETALPGAHLTALCDPRRRFQRSGAFQILETTTSAFDCARTANWQERFWNTVPPL